MSASRASLYTFGACTTSHIGTRGSVQHKTGISARFHPRLGMPTLIPRRTLGTLITITVLVSENKVSYVALTPVYPQGQSISIHRVVKF